MSRRASRCDDDAFYLFFQKQKRVCVGCLFLRTPSRAHYRTPSACANLSKAFITPTSHPLSNLCAMYLPCCMQTHKQKSENANANSHEHISTSRARTHTHTRKHQHRNTCTRHLQSLDDDVLRHILQHHIWVCLIIPDRIERSHLICFTCSTLFLRLYWNRIWQRGRGPLL
jgi:hypothetical protein